MQAHSGFRIDVDRAGTQVMLRVSISTAEELVGLWPLEQFIS
jgi:hypothetical protein